MYRPTHPWRQRMGGEKHKTHNSKLKTRASSHGIGTHWVGPKRSRMMPMRSVVAWSLGSPQIAVRPP